MIKSLLPAILLLSTATHAQTISAEEVKKLTATLPGSKTDTSQIRTFLKLAKYHVFKPGEHKDDLDSAFHFISRAEQMNADINSKWAEGYILLIRSYWLRESGQKDKAKETVRQAVMILKKEADKNLAGEACMDLGTYLNYNDAAALEERIELVKIAVSSYDQSGNIQQKAASLQMLGDLYGISGNNHLALDQLQAALDAYNSINYRQVQGIYCLMGFMYARLREYNKGLDKQLLALKTAESIGDSSMQLCQIYNYLGEIHLALKEREKAIIYYDKALRVAKRHNDVFAIYLASINIAHSWVTLKNPRKALELMEDINFKYEKPKNNTLEYNMARAYIGAYSALKQFDKARPYVKQVHSLIDNVRVNDMSKLSAYTVLIPFYIAAREDAEASKYLEKHGELAKKLNDFYYLTANQKFRYMLDTLKQDYKSAMKNLLETSKMTDSLARITSNKELSELQVQFETEKKEAEIIAKTKDIQLLTKQSELQKSRIEKSKLMRNWIIAGASMLLLIVVLLYRQSLARKKNNRIIRIKNEELQHLVTEKEWLLKEVHHRIKNNLQIVMSLLNSQSAYIDNEPALAAIHDSQHRVHAMSLIHQKLYNSENVSVIDMSFYIQELVSYLGDSFDTGQRIRFEYYIEPLELDVSQAVPLGLILNEAITNSIKYAFPNNRNGLITISLSQTTPPYYLLTISDNGIGMPSDLSDTKPGSLGMSLMTGLSEDLEGEFSLEKNNGTTIKVSFKCDLSVKRHDTMAELSVSHN